MSGYSSCFSKSTLRANGCVHSYRPRDAVGDNPIWYLVKGFGVIFLITFGFYWAERYWLKESLSLPDIMNEDITRRMYPLF